MSSLRAQRGAASVEHVGLAFMLALLFAALVVAVAAQPPEDSGARELTSAIARRIRCAPSEPGPCWQDPLTEAYGRRLGGVARAFAPVPRTVIGPSGAGLLPVDFRYCRRESCAIPGERPELTASNRRVTAFLAIDDRRRSDGTVRLDYWLYRPTIGWGPERRTATSPDVERHGMTPLLESDNPRLVPLETLDGRNHVDFPASEEPPWRWRVQSVYPE